MLKNYFRSEPVASPTPAPGVFLVGVQNMGDLCRGCAGTAIALRLRPSFPQAKRAEGLETRYREQLKDVVPELIAKWQPRLKVEVETFFVRRMKTKWGSCSPATKSIRLSTDSAKKPKAYLEYVVLYELVQLLEATHNRFVALIDQFMPDRTFYQRELNRLPVRQERWPDQQNEQYNT